MSGITGRAAAAMHAAAGIGTSPLCGAQAYPSKPIRIVNAFAPPAGGPPTWWHVISRNGSPKRWASRSR